MKGKERFTELWNDYLEGELDESGIAELQALVEEDNRLVQMATDSYQIHRLLGLIAQDNPSRQDSFVSETLARLPADNDRFVSQVMQHLPQRSPRKGKTDYMYLVKWTAAITTVAVITLIASLYFQQSSAERRIAKITGLSGSLQWTGDGGQVFHNLSAGKELPGGTIEGMVPDSWLELEFNDGSTVTISGNSTLTFSDHDQKKLYLKEGNVSGNVKPQPTGKPMLIYTRSAVLEILGTQFELEARLATTTLNVSEGNVRVKRLSDGNTVDVPAKHRVIATADREMLPKPVPDSINRWKSQLHLGPEGAYGKWSPKTATEEAKLRTIPLTIPQGLTIYTAALGVSRGDTPQVILQPGCRLRVKGHIASTHKVYFGITVMYPGGGFAGRFENIRQAIEFESGEDFEMLLDLRKFRLDPSLAKIKDKLPGAPFHLVVETVWCHTLDHPSGLEIIEVEFLPPMTLVNLLPTELPVMDIWAATSQGNLKIVKRHLAAGADINEAFVAPGIPASGATPLHMSVLSDQHELARFLIDKGANINAPAKDEHGGTPLHWAAVLGRVALARQLIDAGANVNARDKNGYTPLDATTYEQFSESKYRLEIAELLRDKGGESGDVQ